MSNSPSINPATGFSSAPQPILPSTDLSVPAGFAAPAFIQTAQRQSSGAGASASLAAKVLRDPLLLRMVSDRVYELMLEDLHNQRERSRNYGRPYG